jgi:hypothetical protein
MGSAGFQPARAKVPASPCRAKRGLRPGRTPGRAGWKPALPMHRAVVASGGARVFIEVKHD